MRVRTHPSTRTPADARAPRSSRLGERLRQLRVSAGLTQSELAGDRFSKEYVSQIERGKTRPTEETMLWLAERLGADGQYLLTGGSTTHLAVVEAGLAQAGGPGQNGRPEGGAGAVAR